MFEGMFKGKKKPTGIGKFEVGDENMLKILPNLERDDAGSSGKSRERMQGEVLEGKNETVPQPNQSPEHVEGPAQAVSGGERAPESPSETAESVATPALEAVPRQKGQPKNRLWPIVGRESDKWIGDHLEKIDSLAFKPGFPPEELGLEVEPSSSKLGKLKEDGTDQTPKINREKPQAQNNISPEDFKNFVYSGEAPKDALDAIAGKIVKREPLSRQEEDIRSGASQRVEDILQKKKEESESPKRKEVPENLPGSSQDEYKAFEENLRKNVADWRAEKIRKEGKDTSSLHEVQQEAVSTLFGNEDGSEVMQDGTPEERRTYFKDFVAKSVEKLRAMRKQPHSSERNEPPKPHSKESAGKPDGPTAEIKEEIDAAQERIRMSERGASLKEYLTETGTIMQEKAEKYGKPFAQYLGGKIEQYNKLSRKTRFAITFGLTAGSVLTGPGGWVTAALWTTRGVGALGFAMNRYAAMNKKLEAGKNVWFVGDSERSKYARATVEAALYMASTSALMYGGMELGKMAIQSEWLHNVGTAAKEGIDTVKEFDTTKWLAGMLNKLPSWPSSDVPPAPPGGAEIPGVSEMRGPEGLPLTKDEIEALTSTPGTLEPEATAMPEAHGEWYNATDPRIDKGIADVKETLDRMQKLTGEQSKILDSMPDGTSHVSKDAPFGRDPILGRPLGEEGAKKLEELTRSIANAPEAATRDRLEGLNKNWNTLYEQREQIRTDLHTAEAEGSAGAASELRSAEAHVSEQMRDIKHSYEAAGADTPFGRDPLDGHPMTEQEAKALEQLQNAMHDPRQTGAFPHEEKGFFERLFGSSDTAEAAGQFSIDSVSAVEPHIYADAEGNLSVYGGSPEQKIDFITEFFSKNPNVQAVFGSDDNGIHRVLWTRQGENPLPVPQMVHKGGFSSFLSLFTGGSSFAEAPKPEEFVKIIK